MNDCSTYVHTYPNGLPVLPAIQQNREALRFISSSLLGLLHSLGNQRPALQRATGKNAQLSGTQKTRYTHPGCHFGIRPAGTDETPLSWEEIECAINCGVMF